ncbi:MAG: hypothetical protein K2L98_04335 [Bacilli bacterium]|nr:hypothetical protein [Bacilli bacterium]
MKILFISGGSGSGKTTVCDYLEKRYNIPCIHVDDIVAEYNLGQEYISIVLAYRKYYDEINCGNYENIISDNGIDVDVKIRLKRLIEILNNRVNEMIMNYEASNQPYITVEFLVPSMLTCFHQSSLKIFLSKSIENRLQALNKRIRRFAVYDLPDKELTESNLLNRDIYSFYDDFHLGNQDFDIVIENENTVESLYAEIDKIMDTFIENRISKN